MGVLGGRDLRLSSRREVGAIALMRAGTAVRR
jgi:hypothetical protein